jgi:hypothetical protein
LASEVIELLLHLLYRARLIGNYLECVGELLLAHDGHDFHGGLLLRLHDQIGVALSDLLDVIPNNGDVVDGEEWIYGEPC